LRRGAEERRQRIIRAAHELIPAVGVQGLTHRLIADRAGVPLGSTTYYFATLAELVDAALTNATDVTTACLRDWGERLQASADVPVTLAELVEEWVEDRDQLVTWNELYAAAGHRPDLLTAYAVDRQAAHDTAAFVDGVVMHALIRDERIAPAPVARVLSVLLAHGAG
jgi:DNA-binding transcriptional regulator YbjK